MTITSYWRDALASAAGSRSAVSVRLGLRGLVARLVEVARRCSRQTLASKIPARRRVLLVANNDLAVTHLAPYARLLNAAENIETTVTTPWLFKRRFPHVSPAERLGAPRLSLTRALFAPWDLILFASHYHPGLFAQKAAKVYISHGLATGRTMRGGDDYVYGHKALASRSRPAYRAIFAASDAEKEYARSLAPELAPLVVEVGDLLVDRMLKIERKRQLVRRLLGLRDDEIAVLIMSTWGSRSLLATEGPALYRAASELPRPFKAFATIHPHHFRDARSKAAIACLERSNVTLIDRQASWLPCLVAADVAIADETSLALYFALLNRPLLYLPCNQNAVHRDGPWMQMRRFWRELDPQGPLERQLRTALATHPVDVLDAYLASHYSTRGRAQEKISGILAEFVSGGGIRER